MDGLVALGSIPTVGTFRADLVPRLMIQWSLAMKTKEVKAQSTG
jgi:hypothetical protein